MNHVMAVFIGTQTCASICCMDEQGMPYCFSCFYIYNAEKNLLYFKSHADTKHIGLLLKNPVAAGTILPDKLNKRSIQGIQFSGQLLSVMDDQAKNSSMHYHKRFPLALALPGKVWTLQLNQLKMTDSSKIFGKKIKWERQNKVLKDG
jgi:uncharacterized protein YhbP (UPF0306 family)